MLRFVRILVISALIAYVAAQQGSILYDGGSSVRDQRRPPHKPISELPENPGNNPQEIVNYNRPSSYTSRQIVGSSQIAEPGHRSSGPIQSPVYHRATVPTSTSPTYSWPLTAQPEINQVHPLSGNIPANNIDYSQTVGEIPTRSIDLSELERNLNNSGPNSSSEYDSNHIAGKNELSFSLNPQQKQTRRLNEPLIHPQLIYPQQDPSPSQYNPASYMQPQAKPKPRLYDPSVYPQHDLTSGPDDPSLYPQPDPSPGQYELELTPSLNDPSLYPQAEPKLRLYDPSVYPLQNFTTGPYDTSSYPQEKPTPVPFDKSLYSQLELTSEPDDPSIYPQPSMYDPSLYPQPHTALETYNPLTNSQPNPSSRPQPSLEPNSPLTYPKLHLTLANYDSTTYPRPQPSSVPYGPPTYLQSQPSLESNSPSTYLQPQPAQGPYDTSTYPQPTSEPFDPSTFPPQPHPTAGPYDPSTHPQSQPTPGPYDPSTYPQPQPTIEPYDPSTYPQPTSGSYETLTYPQPQPTLEPYDPSTYSPPQPTLGPYDTSTYPQPQPSPGFNDLSTYPQPQPTIGPYDPSTYTQTQPIQHLYDSSTYPHPQTTPDLAPSTPRTLQPTVIQNFTCDQKNEYHRIAEYCDAYVVCQATIPRQHICPDGLLFNPAIRYPEYPCSYPSEVKCTDGTNIQPPKPTNECPRQYGYYSSTDGECSRYKMCQEGKAIMMHCPLGLVFNELWDSCDWPENVPLCNPNVYKHFSCPKLQDEDGKQSDQLYKYKYGAQCRYYIACHRGHPRLLSCDNGLSFDDKLQACVDSNFVEDCPA